MLGSIASYLLGQNKYLVEFLARNKLPTCIKSWCHLLVPAPIIYEFLNPSLMPCPCTHFIDLPRYKNDKWFLSVILHWIYNYKCHTKVFWKAKRYLLVIIILPMFSYLYFKCCEIRGRLLNSWNGYQKLYINKVKWS